MYKKTPHALAGEVDRNLKLSLSNSEFEILAEIIRDSPEPEQTSRNMMMCDAEVVWYLIKLER